MYIEHTPLEHNLQEILRSHRLSSAIGVPSVPLAHVQEFSHAETQEAAAYGSVRADDLTVGRGPHIANIATTAAALPQHQQQHQQHHQQQQTDNIVAASQLATDYVTDGETEEYDLIDIIDTEDPEDGGDLQGKDLQVPAPNSIAARVSPTPTPTSTPVEVNIRIEEAADDCISITIEEDSPSRLRTTSQPHLRSSAVAPPVYTRSADRPHKSPAPLPSIIPLVKGGPSKRFAPRIRLLNGSLPLYQEDSCDESSADEIEEDGPGAQPWHHQPRRPQQQLQPRPQLEYGERLTHILTDLEDLREEIEGNYGQGTQMGIDIVSKLRHLLNLNSSSNYSTHQGDNRKRRSDTNWPLDEARPQQIKYRKVENRFPKFVDRTLEDDDVEIVRAYTPRNEHNQQPRYSASNAPIMSQRKPLHPNEPSKMRKSIFSAPQTANKLVKNTSYADVEFSDGEDISVYADGVNGYSAGARAAHSPPTSCRQSNALLTPNIPNRQPSSGERHQQPDGLSVPRRKPTYAEALRHNMPRSGGHVLGGRATSSICSSAASTSGSVRANSGLLNNRTNGWSGNMRSILVQEKESEERDKYQQLLEMVVPCLYRIDKTGPQAGVAASASAAIVAGTLSSGAGLSERQQGGSIKPNASARTVDGLLAGRQPLNQQHNNSLMAPPPAYTIVLDDDNGGAQSSPRSTSWRRGTSNVSLRSKLGVSPHPSATSTARNTPASSVKAYSQQYQFPSAKTAAQQPYTIDLEDDDDDGDLTFTGVLRNAARPAKNGPLNVSIDVDADDDDNDDITEIVDLSEAERNVLSVCKKFKKDREGVSIPPRADRKIFKPPLPYVEPVNSLQDRFNASPHLKENWLEKWKLKWSEKKRHRTLEVNETAKIVERLAADRHAAELEINERLKNFTIFDPQLVVLDDFAETVEEEEPEFIELSEEHQKRVQAAICGPPDQVLVTKFNLNITRRDIHTLLDHNWLNDEVINFYMNLLTERSEKRHESHGLPQVYAMNTFFVPRLMQAGHGGVKRWTRKVDIFSKDIIPVPVHVGGVHWCMAIVHLKNRTIKYYDSMGTPNPNVLRALEQYLKDESLDKRKRPFDTSDFEVDSVQNVPRQMNGSDCGVFSCMFAEYITRDKEITFSQQNMEYFRHKMILEIVQGELLH